MLTACGTTAPQPGDPCAVFKCQSGKMYYESDGGIGGASTARINARALTIYNTQGRRIGTIK